MFDLDATSCPISYSLFIFIKQSNGPLSNVALVQSGTNYLPSLMGNIHAILLLLD